MNPILHINIILIMIPWCCLLIPPSALDAEPTERRGHRPKQEHQQRASYNSASEEDRVLKNDCHRFILTAIFRHVRRNDETEENDRCCHQIQYIC